MGSEKQEWLQLFSGRLDILGSTVSNVSNFLFGKRSSNLCRGTKYHRTVRDDHVLCDECASSYNAIIPNDSTVEDNGAHADGTVVADGASMQDRTMSNCDPFANNTGKSGINMDGAVVLNVASCTNLDLVFVRTQHSVMSDTDIRCKRDCPSNDRSRCYLAGRVQRWGMAANRIQHDKTPFQKKKAISNKGNCR